MKKTILKKYRTIVFLILIMFLLFTRFYKLGSAPESMIIDEAHHGYIAYSLLETGRDEHAVSYPLVFKGFGDYKLPAYPYLLTPLIKLISLNNFTVRLPSAIAGILIIFATYFLFLNWGFKKKLAVLAAIIIAFSPWSFILSRFAYESNLALMFFIFALLFFTKAYKNNQKLFYLLSSIFFGLTGFAYVSYKIISPVFLIFLTVFLFFKNKKHRKSLLYFILPFIILFSPFFINNNSNSNVARFKQIGFLSDGSLVREINEKRSLCLAEYPQKFCYLAWNKASLSFREFLNKYIKLYSPEYLFSQGDQDLYYMNVKNTGQFLPILFPLYILGFVFFFREILAKDRKKKELFYLFILGIVICPLPAILSGLQKVRLSALLPFIILILVWGYQYLVENFKKYMNLIDFFFISILLVSFLSYFVNFSSIHVIKYDLYYDSFVKNIFIYLEDYEKTNGFDEAVIDDFFSDPIMYYAYYQKVDPQFYQDNVVLADLEGSGFQHARSLGKYFVARADEEITNVACKAAREKKKVLYITNRSDFVAEKKEDSFLIKIIKSVDDVMDYAFIYNVTDYGKFLTKEGRCP